jgi:hypothetical protein
MSSDRPLAWKYAPRALGFVGVVVGVVAVLIVASLLLPPFELEPTPSTASWVAMFALWAPALAGLLATGTFTRGAHENPRDWIDPSWRLRLVLALVLLPTVVCGLWATPTSGPNIALLELAGSEKQAQLLGYGDGVVEDALRGDLGFIASYVLLLVLLTRWTGCFYRLETLRRARVPVSFIVMAAGVLDLVEDGLLAIGISHPDAKRDIVWELAATCAWAKFALLLGVLAYIACGLWTWLFTPGWVREASWALPAPAPASKDLAASRPRSTPFGIALSGGGIRASSISLGALQVLESDTDGPPLGWGQASVVTAVSGGSNMAAGWSIARSHYDTGTYGCDQRVDPDTLDPPPWSLQDEMTKEEAHLFANLGYLLSSSPRATADDSDAPRTEAERTADQSTAARSQTFRPSALATVLTGFVLNVAVLLTSLWVLVTPFGWMLAELNRRELRKGDYEKLVASHHLAFPGLTLIGLGIGLVLLWVVLGQFLSRNIGTSIAKQRLFLSCKVGGYGLLGIGAILVLVLYGLPMLASWLDRSGLQTLIGSLAGAAGVIGSVGRILRRPTAQFAPYLGGVAFALFAVLLTGYWTSRAARLELTSSAFPRAGHQSVLWWLVAIGVLVLVQLFVSPERWSLAGFYRGKLRVAYATYRDPEDALRVYQNDTATTEQHEREPWLHSFENNGRATTPLTVCGTATVSSRSVRTHYAIPALSVTFDPQHVTVHVPTSDKGTWAVHQAPAEVINAMGAAGHKRLTPMLAVAIASAAVSPAMGRIRIGPTRMLLAFANIRLGVWMPNPRYVNAYNDTVDSYVSPASTADNKEEAARAYENYLRAMPMSKLSTEDRKAHPIGYPRTGLGYLFKEFLGIHDLSDPYVYMTDGGHWENTGLVEMLRRKDIREIVCIDADCGSLEATSSLGKAMDLAPLECGVQIQANLDPLRASHSDSSAPGYAQRTTTVGFFRVGSDWGSVGVLWYTKPGLTEDMSAALLGFRETHPDYPVVTTTDQFFDSSTYIAYRELGRYNGQQILTARQRLVAFLQDIDVSTEAGLLDRLEAALESHQHWVVADLVHAMHFAPSAAKKVAFLRAVRTTLSATTDSVGQKG